MMTGLMPSDLKRWAAWYLRGALAAYGVDVNVATRTPKTIRYPLDKPLLVVDELTPTRYDLTQWDQELSVSVRAGTRQNDRECDDLARLVCGILTDPGICMADGSPISSVETSNGPYQVDDPADVARNYLTVEYHCVGQPMPTPIQQ